MSEEAHSNRAHAKLAPSSAHRWINCVGSVALTRGVVETPSPYAAEGTAAHMLAEKCLTRGTDAIEWKGFFIDTQANYGNSAWFRPDYPGMKADGKRIFKVDADMIDGVQTYLDECASIVETADEFEIEHRMDMTGLVADCFGTGDLIAYNEAAHRITICDLKYGKGVPVDVKENEQELTYALGVAQRYHNRGVDEVELVVVQPRCPHKDGPVRRWSTDLVGLYEHLMAARNAAARIAAGDTTLTPGEWCKFCKAAAFCPAIKAKILAAIGAAIKDGKVVAVSDPKTFTPQQLADALVTWQTYVKTWGSAVEQFAHTEALQGRVLPGWKLVGKRPTRKWNDEDTAVERLRMAGVSDDDLFETKMCSPASVEKALPKNERAIIAALSTKVSSGSVLAPLTDPRPAIDPQDASGFEAVDIGE